MLDCRRESHPVPYFVPPMSSYARLRCSPAIRMQGCMVVATYFAQMVAAKCFARAPWEKRSRVVRTGAASQLEHTTSVNQPLMSSTVVCQIAKSRHRNKAKSPAAEDRGGRQGWPHRILHRRSLPQTASQPRSCSGSAPFPGRTGGAQPLCHGRVRVVPPHAEHAQEHVRAPQRRL